jgi:UDP-N-acetylmuramoyl-L-alanyl-D-glutamate--2,6-diaminopimelate ligase
MLEKTLRTIEKIIPKSIFRFFQPWYHYTLGLIGAIIYGFPSQKMLVVLVTGTKGKTTTSELIFRIFREMGYHSALINTIEFCIDEDRRRNYFKMTTPGRLTLQKFLKEAYKKGCTHAVVEVSSEAVLQFRHRFLYPDAVVVTNLSPEHIERHGSFENYRNAKLEIAKRLLKSNKPRSILITNLDEETLSPFRHLPIKEQYAFSLNDIKPIAKDGDGNSFIWHNRRLHVHTPGEFNVYNVLSAITLADAYNIPPEKQIAAIEKFHGSRGRVEKVDLGQNFTVIVDYAHTADSMEKLYKTFSGRKICVFGATGGGRDKWKRSEMGRIASTYCDEIILTNDDPYDENPESIVADIKNGVTNPKVLVEIDRRKAIRMALKKANKDSVVLITGKGTDPYLMESGGKKTPWDDVDVTKEELHNL